MSRYRPNNARARQLRFEIEATRLALEEAYASGGNIDRLMELRDELRDLEREFFYTGSTRESEL